VDLRITNAAQLQLNFKTFPNFLLSSTILTRTGTNQMEEDRLQVDLGIAADIEEEQVTAHQRLPKKRFVGRRHAAEAALKNSSNENGVDSLESPGAVQSISIHHFHV
jgi:hypothetical protein